MEKLPFATIIFEADEYDGKYKDVTLVQAYRPGGAVIECATCEMDVDDIIDAPGLHQDKCTSP